LQAVQRARRGEGTSLIENKTYRIKGHFEGDPQKYRTEEEVKGWQSEKDPIRRFVDFLAAQGLLKAELDRRIQNEAAVRLKDAVAFAEASPFPDPEEALEDLFASY
jgi:pyruvate dehydrogenase E1 component alpha subunit